MKVDDIPEIKADTNVRVVNSDYKVPNPCLGTLTL